MGNRLTRSGAGTDTYAYSGTSNRLSTLTPPSGPARTFVHDSNGSITSDGINTHAYDTRGRMAQTTNALGTTTYQVNALGQRTRKTSLYGDTVYTYDLQGHLIAESSAAGATLKEYVWLGDIPIAVVHSTSRYYIHVDHLNIPRLVANQGGQTVWRWDQQEPFGNNVPDENPSGLGVFEQPLRFPGQYADKETNLHYNYYRDYDPSLGIYKQSDPIGLRGGVNTYAYVSGDPLRLTDAMGLQAAPGIPIPLPPIAIPGSPANKGWVSSFNQLLKKIKEMCTSRGKCRLYDAILDIDPNQISIDPSSPRPILVGGVIKCFYRCDSGDHQVRRYPTTPGFSMTRAQALQWCPQEFDE